jgi:hypothetical protein
MLTKSDIEKAVELGKKFPNNQDLGKKFRSVYKMNEFVLSIPNDFDLGNELRKIIYKRSTSDSSFIDRV